MPIDPYEMGRRLARTALEVQKLAAQAGAAAGVALADLLTRGEHRHLAMRADALADLAGYDADTTDDLERRLTALREQNATLSYGNASLASWLDAVAAVLRKRGHQPPQFHADLAQAVATVLDTPAVSRAEIVDQLDADMACWSRSTPEGASWPVPELVRRQLAMVLGVRVSGWVRAARVLGEARAAPLEPTTTTPIEPIKHTTGAQA